MSDNVLPFPVRELTAEQQEADVGIQLTNLAHNVSEGTYGKVETAITIIAAETGIEIFSGGDRDDKVCIQLVDAALTEMIRRSLEP